MKMKIAFSGENCKNFAHDDIESYRVERSWHEFGYASASP